MAKLAQFDPTAPQPAPVIGWYDTDLLHYPNLPVSVILLTDEDWAGRLFGHWAVQDGQLVPLPLPPASL